MSSSSFCFLRSTTSSGYESIAMKFFLAILALLLHVQESTTTAEDRYLYDRSHARFRSMWSASNAPMTQPVQAKHCRLAVPSSSRASEDDLASEDRLRGRVREVTRQSGGSIVGDYGPFFLRKRTRFDHRLRCTTCDAQVLPCSPILAQFEPQPIVSSFCGSLQTKAWEGLERARASYKIGLGKHLLADDRAIESSCNVKRLVGKPTMRCGTKSVSCFADLGSLLPLQTAGARSGSGKWAPPICDPTGSLSCVCSPC